MFADSAPDGSGEFSGTESHAVNVAKDTNMKKWQGFMGITIAEH